MKTNNSSKDGKKKMKLQKKRIKLLTKQLDTLEEKLKRQIATMNHIKRIVFYELSPEKWEKMISDPIIDQDYQKLLLEPIDLS